MFQTLGCNMQFGGDDQWSNMLGGTELIRRKLGKDAHAMTITLLTVSYTHLDVYKRQALFRQPRRENGAEKVPASRQHPV